MTPPTDPTERAREYADMLERANCHGHIDVSMAMTQAADVLREMAAAHAQQAEEIARLKEWKREHEDCIAEEAAAFSKSLEQALDRAEAAEAEIARLKGELESAFEGDAMTPPPDPTEELKAKGYHVQACPWCLSRGLECRHPKLGMDPIVVLRWIAKMQERGGHFGRSNTLDSVADYICTLFADYAQQSNENARLRQELGTARRGSTTATSRVHVKRTAMTSETDARRAALRERLLEEALRELVTLVRGECPALLNEDSGGDARLSLAIDAALSAPSPSEAASSSASEMRTIARLASTAALASQQDVSFDAPSHSDWLTTVADLLNRAEHLKGLRLVEVPVLVTALREARAEFRRMKEHIRDAPSHSEDIVRGLANEIQARGRKHATGEPLFFDRHNLELAIRDALAARVRELEAGDIPAAGKQP